MELIEVDDIGLQAAKAVLNDLHDALAPQGRHNLGAQYHFLPVAAAGEPLPQNCLRCAGGIDFGRVDQVDTPVHGVVDNREGLFGIDFTAKGYAAQTD